jgi:hypothetical protein
MSEVESFGNVVNALRSVRDDYNDHLKSVPQYEAFLLLESSTLKVAATLQAGADPAGSPIAAGVIESLEMAKTKFREHLTGVPEYRALLAIDKLITEVSADLGVGAAQSIPAAPVEALPPAEQPGAVAQSDVAEQAVAETIAVAQVENAEPATEPQSEVAQTYVAEQATADASAVQFDVPEQDVEQQAVIQTDVVGEHPAVNTAALGQANVAEQPGAIAQSEVAELAVLDTTAVAQADIAQTEVVQADVAEHPLADATAVSEGHQPAPVQPNEVATYSTTAESDSSVPTSTESFPENEEKAA